jgi:hygromycin-B 4-O-kinase
MNREEWLKTHLPESLSLQAIGRILNELTIEEFEQEYKRIFDSIMEIHQVDVADTIGYGEFTMDGKLPYSTCKEFLQETFNEEREGYWKNWKKLFEGPLLDQDFFHTYYNKMMDYSDFCEGKRFLVNGFVYFDSMTITKETVGFMAWDRSGVYDWMVDFITFDGNKPYLMIPEKLYAYLQENGIEVPYFKERFLCIAYFRGIDGLRWHASIDDEESCKSIMVHLASLEERILNFK